VIVFFNGQFVPEADAVVSVFDRSFQFGDGLFETLRLVQGHPFAWDAHLDRLQRGAEALRIRMPFDGAQLLGAARELAVRNNVTDGLLRITLSRGIGPRGYSPRGADQPVLVMSVQATDPLPAAPVQWTLYTASLRLPAGAPLARWKTANKLVQIMARAEAEERGCNDALLLNDRGEVCESTCGNLFCLIGDTLATPPADSGLLPGVTRAIVLALARDLGLTVRESLLRPDDLRRADGAFLTLSSLGLVEIARLDDSPLSCSPRTKKLYERYLQELMA